MTIQMIIALAITVLMIILIMNERIPFGAAPLFACLLLVILVSLILRAHLLVSRMLPLLC
ncbi:hypothetical protein ACWOBH_10565 [Globicatella sanguinis]